MNRLSVVGLGKLGACTAACFASRGFPTLGLDVNDALVRVINEGGAPVQEPGLDELIRLSARHLRATSDYRMVIDESDVTFLIVPTPSQSDGHFSDGFLRDALKQLSRALRQSDKASHQFVVTSTVSPGTTDRALIPLIEAESGRRLNQGFTVCYNPEFIALGSVIRDFLNPDLVLIGESHASAGAVLEGLYRQVCQTRPYVARMSIVGAEITKLSLNAYATMKISFANTLTAICERMPGADIDAITRALGADRRVSPFGLKGGLPFGGPCFPRDNRAFAAFARAHGFEAHLADATDRVNHKQIDLLVDLVWREVERAGDGVAVLGLAYKRDTPVLEESPGLDLVETLLGRGVAVSVYDPLAMDNARAVLGSRVRYAGSARECMADAAVTVITLSVPEFGEIDDSYISHNPATIVDCWRIVEPSRFRKNVRYVALGIPHEHDD